MQKKNNCRILTALEWVLSILGVKYGLCVSGCTTGVSVGGGNVWFSGWKVGF